MPSLLFTYFSTFTIVIGLNVGFFQKILTWEYVYCFFEGGRVGERHRERETERERKRQRVREREREREKHWGGRATSINWLPLLWPLTGDRTCKLGLHPDQELNWQPFGIWDDMQTNGATWPGACKLLMESLIKEKNNQESSAFIEVLSTDLNRTKLN